MEKGIFEKTGLIAIGAACVFAIVVILLLFFNRPFEEGKMMEDVQEHDSPQNKETDVVFSDADREEFAQWEGVFVRYFNGTQRNEAKEYIRTMQERPEDPMPYLHIGRIYYESALRFGDFELHDLSIEYFAMASQHDPNNASFHEYIGWVALNKEDLELSLKAFNDSLAMQKTRSARIGQGWSLYGLGRSSEAATSFEEALRLRENSPNILGTKQDAYAGLGWSSYRLQEYDKALSLFKNAQDTSLVRMGMIASELSLHRQETSLPDIFTYQKTGYRGNQNNELFGCIGDDYLKVVPCVNMHHWFGIETN